MCGCEGTGAAAHDNPRLIVICGLSFAGKTTLGQAIAERFGCAVVDVDATKARLLGVGFEENALDQAVWDRVYAETDAEIIAHLRRGEPVVDASRNFRKEERDAARALARGEGAGFVLIYVDTPERVCRERLAANRRTRARVDWGDDAFEQVLAAMQPPDASEQPEVFHHDEDIEAWLAAHARMLSAVRPLR